VRHTAGVANGTAAWLVLVCTPKHQGAATRVVSAAATSPPANRHPHLWAVCAPHLGAVENIPVALLLSARAHADGVRACPRLADGQRADVLACERACGELGRQHQIV
jgi:hypothetical protein